jgi:hypothetical protein
MAARDSSPPSGVKDSWGWPSAFSPKADLQSPGSGCCRSWDRSRPRVKHRV